MNTHTRLTVALALSVACLVFALGLAPAVAGAAPPTMTRGEIVARAETAIGLDYVWGKESWVPNAGSGSGTDCSGLVLKCWEVPKTLLYVEENGANATIAPRYTTYDFYNCLGAWYPLAGRSELRQGDILVKNNGTSGHVVLYAGGDSWNYPVIYEAPGTGLTIRRVSRYLGSEYLPRRRSYLTETDDIILDNPTAKTVGGSDTWSNWTRSTSVAGYYGHNYQVRAGSATAGWARWTPRLAASGYYDVYIRWTSGSDRASAAQVIVRSPTAAYTSYVDQRSGGGQWHLLGRRYFNAGYSITEGSVTIYAGTTGYVVADAVKFSPAILY